MSGDCIGTFLSPFFVYTAVTLIISCCAEINQLHINYGESKNREAIPYKQRSVSLLM